MAVSAVSRLTKIINYSTIALMCYLFFIIIKSAMIVHGYSWVSWSDLWHADFWYLQIRRLGSFIGFIFRIDNLVFIPLLLLSLILYFHRRSLKIALIKASSNFPRTLMMRKNSVHMNGSQGTNLRICDLGFRPA